MKLSVSLDTQIVTATPNPLRIKAGSKVPCEVTFTRNSRTILLQSPLVEFAVKPDGAFDVDLLVFHNAFSATANNAYVGTINTDTVSLRDVLGLGDGSVATDKPQIEASGEIAWTVNAETFRSATFPVIVEAPIANSGAQPVPATPPYPDPANIEVISRKGQPYGYAALDEQGKVPSAQIGEHDHEIARIIGLQDSLDARLSLDPDGQIHRIILVPEGVSISDVGGSIWATDVGTGTPLDWRLLDIEGVIQNVDAANGLCPLGPDAKVPPANLPESILGATKFQGVWNAATNQPPIPAASSANKGWYYIVTTEGTSAINGISDWKLGDWILSIGSSWVKVDNTDAVITVNGKTGIVTLGKADIGLGSVDNTADADKPVSTAQAAAIASHNASLNAHGQTNFSRQLVIANGAADVFSALGIGLQGRVLVTAYWPTGSLLWADSGTWSSILLTAFTRAFLAAADAAAGRSLLGLGNVDNTSDSNKPVSTAQATALAGKVGTDGTVQNVVSLTQAQYNALNPKIATTLYLIVG